MEPTEITDYRSKNFKNMIYIGLFTIFLMGLAQFSINFLFSPLKNSQKFTSQILSTNE